MRGEACPASSSIELAGIALQQPADKLDGPSALRLSSAKPVEAK